MNVMRDIGIGGRGVIPQEHAGPEVTSDEKIKSTVEKWRKCQKRMSRSAFCIDEVISEDMLKRYITEYKKRKLKNK